MKQNYKGFEIGTHQDSLGRWHATVTDNDAGMMLATTPKDENYGTDMEQQAVYAARALIERTLAKGY